MLDAEGKQAPWGACFACLRNVEPCALLVTAASTSAIVPAAEGAKKQNPDDPITAGIVVAVAATARIGSEETITIPTTAG